MGAFSDIQKFFRRSVYWKINRFFQIPAKNLVDGKAREFSFFDLGLIAVLKEIFKAYEVVFFGAFAITGKTFKNSFT